MKRKILVFALLLSLVITLIPTSTSMFEATSASPDTGWTLVTDAREMKAYPDLREYIWQKDATMPPNGEYDKIGLHRLVKTGSTPKGVVFINSGTYGYGGSWISNPSTDSFTKIENESQAIYWANRGFDVYAIDSRTHFVPATLNTSQLGFMANWGWDQWISDIKEAVEKAKETSGVSQVFMVGISFGGRATMNYATVYGQDLRGIILLDG
jgi:dienelactone hydrolase